MRGNVTLTPPALIIQEEPELRFLTRVGARLCPDYTQIRRQWRRILIARRFSK